MKTNLKQVLMVLGLAGTALSNAVGAEKWVDGVSRDSGWVDVDKSKLSKYNEETGWFDNSETGDGFLCWAASAANIVTWWHQQNPQAAKLNPQAPATKDTVWQLYRDNFENKTGGVAAAVRWYMNGTLPTAEPYPKESASKNGAYYKDLVEVTGERYEIRQFNSAGEYVENEEGVQVWVPYNPDVDARLAIADKIVSLLDDGYIISLGVSDEHLTKHATTLWGVQTDKDGYLAKMWITDSDDYLNGYGTGLIELTCKPIINELTVGQGLKYSQEDAYGINSLSVSNGADRLWYSSEEPRNDYFYEFTAIKLTKLAPEPATATLSLLALAGLCTRRRRK